MFQSTRPRGARRMVVEGGVSDSQFQSTRPRGARPVRQQPIVSQRCFNPRAHVGRDDLEELAYFIQDVSIHAPTWGATEAANFDWFAQVFQSTRPRGARQKETGFYSSFDVSIHAPTWGATLEYVDEHDSQMVFQSTRPRGARQHSRCNIRSTPCFNPRAHVGRDCYRAGWRSGAMGFQSTRPRGARPLGNDHQLKHVWFQSTRPRGARLRQHRQSQLHEVSIHAPTWGATKDCFYTWQEYPGFNPRAHVGRDVEWLVLATTLRVSIHAPTWGATTIVSRTRTIICFNPRAHVGRDTMTYQGLAGRTFQSTRPRGARHATGIVARLYLVSIHAPTWGATATGSVIVSPSVFQSTRPRGARRKNIGTKDCKTVSIHAPTWGATGFYSSPRKKRLFQSTRPRGARLLILVASPVVAQVSIHAPTWGATQYPCCRHSKYRVSIHAPTWGATHDDR